MEHPPDRSDESAELCRVLHELAVVERPCPASTAGVGHEVDVETRTEDGMHSVLGVVSRASRDPDEGEAAALRSVVRALLDLLGVESGSACVTVLLGGPRPCVRAVRLGAGPVVRVAADLRIPLPP